MSENNPSIATSPNGPFLVKKVTKITNADNEKIPCEENCALCRCGKSKKKPFCDGDHLSNGFSDKKERKESYDTYEFKGEEITIVDNIGVCAHAGHCVRGAPNAFFGWEGEKRISYPDKETKETIIETIKKCPSGSLAYKIGDRLYDTYYSEKEIFISKDGPLHIRGGIEFQDEKGNKPLSKDHYTLCRCGASKNKPFCDGAHKKSGFKDSE